MIRSSEKKPRPEDHMLHQVVSALADGGQAAAGAGDLAMMALFISQDLAADVGWEGKGESLKEEPLMAQRYNDRYRLQDLSPPKSLVPEWARGRMILVTTQAHQRSVTNANVLPHRLLYEWRPARYGDRCIQGTVRIPLLPGVTTHTIDEGPGRQYDLTLIEMAGAVLRSEGGFNPEGKLLGALINGMHQPSDPSIATARESRFEALHPRQTALFAEYLSAAVHLQN